MLALQSRLCRCLLFSTRRMTVSTGSSRSFGMDENNTNSLIRHVDVRVKENDIQNGALGILKVIRPEWDQKQITFKLLTDGITNKLVGCRPDGADEAETVLIRIYGNKTDLLIDRKAETKNILLLNRAGLAPELYATFKNGLAYQYVPGIVLNWKMARRSDVYKLVARRMARLHKVCVGQAEKTQPVIWDKLRKFLDLVPATFTDPEKNARCNELVTPKSKIEEEVKVLRLHLEHIDSPTVFAHNDLLMGNIILTDGGKEVGFIDYEYAAFNYQAFDIGNHFTEYAGLDDMDYARYPDKMLQTDWLRTYLTEYLGCEPSQAQIERLYVQVNKFSLLSHVFWGVWALIQAEHSYIDFDYIK
ncbi:unnamed protein product [Acanthoscelides obtectus]|nr:unnamed protein product [Acanthoscelides obtectus]CAK1676501.1 Ethanolamine kinase [Acanthoscelides obtectus]